MCHSGWWFGTFVIFPYVGNNHPNWLIFFRGVETTNQHCYVWLTWEMYQSYHHWFQSHHWNGLVILEQLLFPDLPPETSLSLSVYHHHLDPFEQFWSQSFSLIFQTFSSHGFSQVFVAYKVQAMTLNFKIRQTCDQGCLADPRKLAMLDLPQPPTVNTPEVAASSAAPDPSAPCMTLLPDEYWVCGNSMNYPINISLLFLLNHIFIAIPFPTVTGV